MTKPVAFPAGNAQYRDRVLLVSARFTKQGKLLASPQFNSRKPAASQGIHVRVGRVDQTGLTNTHGYPLAIGVLWSGSISGVPTQLMPGWREDNKLVNRAYRLRQRLLILPPLREVPPRVRRYARRSGLVLVRAIHNSDTPRYELACGHCLGPVDYFCSYVEMSGLTFLPAPPVPCWHQGKPEIVGGDGERLECAWCHVEYPVPNELESYS